MTRRDATNLAGPRARTTGCRRLCASTAGFEGSSGSERPRSPRSVSVHCARCQNTELCYESLHYFQQQNETDPLEWILPGA